ncbi:MAG: beta-glucosidase [Bacteroidia bacterium]|nr:MAG: beta-glucosidase [Bacteroidia bacterium]
MTPEEKFWQLFMIPNDLSNESHNLSNGAFGFQVGTRGLIAGNDMQLLEYSPGADAMEAALQINNIQRYFVEETRLGIPLIIFDEALHGLVRTGATAFPQSIALAATFDTSLVRQVSGAIASEVRSRGIRQILSPVINIARDVRWGRTEETYGEDPFLVSEMGVAFVSSFEETGVITTPKHFLANVGEGGRDSYPIQYSERLLREVYLPGFEACFKNGGSKSVMTAYNSIEGTPSSSNDWLLMQLLKGEWGFDGFVISDANAVGGAYSLHHTDSTYEDSGISALEGGLDVIFQTAWEHAELFIQPFLDGRISQERIDDAVKRVLRAKFRLGLFENPYADPALASKLNGSDDHRDLSHQAALESIVLLKNEENLLPLDKRYKKIAVIGEKADANILGGYSGPGINNISVLKGITERSTGGSTVKYEKGCSAGTYQFGDGRKSVNQFISVGSQFLRTTGGERGAVIEYFDNINLSGYPVATGIVAEIGGKWTFLPPHPDLSECWYSIRWTGSIVSPFSGTYNIGLEGNDGYRLYIDGRLVIDNWKKGSFHRMMVPVKLERNREYSISVEFYESVRNGNVRLIWDAGSSGEDGDIARAVDLAASSDIAIVVAGINEGESLDRSNLNLPGRQEELIRKVAATGTPVVVVLINGSAVTMESWIDDTGAIIEAWYPGETGGFAVADVLFGNYNPGGRLPVTFPVNVGQLPLNYNHKPTGRVDDYVDLTGEALFPFGHGLSYTTFEYTDMNFSRAEIDKSENTIATFKVKNTGKFAGDEVVQLYITDLWSSVSRPVIELKGFMRVSLQPGEERELKFEIGFDQLSMLDRNLNRIVEPGEFRILIGSSSREIRLMGILGVK